MEGFEGATSGTRPEKNTGPSTAAGTGRVPPCSGMNSPGRVSPRAPLASDQSGPYDRQRGGPAGRSGIFTQLLSTPDRAEKEHKRAQSREWVQAKKASDGVVAWYRLHEGEKVLVVMNFTRRHRRLLPGGDERWEVMLSTHRETGSVLEGLPVGLFPYEATIFACRAESSCSLP